MSHYVIQYIKATLMKIKAMFLAAKKMPKRATLPLTVTPVPVHTRGDLWPSTRERLCYIVLYTMYNGGKVRKGDFFVIHFQVKFIAKYSIGLSVLYIWGGKTGTFWHSGYKWGCNIKRWWDKSVAQPLQIRFDRFLHFLFRKDNLFLLHAVSI